VGAWRLGGGGVVFCSLERLTSIASGPGRVNEDGGCSCCGRTAQRAWPGGRGWRCAAVLVARLDSGSDRESREAWLSMVTTEKNGCRDRRRWGRGGSDRVWTAGAGGGGGGDDSEDDMAVVLLGARFFPTSFPTVIVAKYYVRWPNKNLCSHSNNVFDFLGKGAEL
jgi:hypothetical protein